MFDSLDEQIRVTNPEAMIIQVIQVITLVNTELKTRKLPLKVSTKKAGIDISS